ncbi:MAG TPA: hypothetical protein VFV33_21590, partial [Gemmatimonadaceae bacterium]|nr:hypothetical protein [Gemmatimonadaceae bacterium]
MSCLPRARVARPVCRASGRLVRAIAVLASVAASSGAPMPLAAQARDTLRLRGDSARADSARRVERV